MPLIYAELDTPLAFTQFQALPDGAKPGHYPGVLVIQKGPAKGHFAVQDGARVVNYNPSNPEHAALQKFQIMIGDDTLADVLECGLANEVTKCKLDHGSTVRDIVGDYSKFNRDGDKVRAELNLDSRLDGYAHAVALIERLSQKIGNSIDFDYFYEIQGNVAIARCRKLNSVDIVDAPAATNCLFAQNLTNNPAPTHMPLDANDIKTIGEMLDSRFGTIKTDFETKFSALSKKFEEGGEDDDEKKKKKADEEKAEMDAKIEKASLAAVEKAFPKAQREQFSKITTQTDSPFEVAVQAQLAAGALNRGIAIQRVSRDLPAVYNAHMSAVNSGKATL